MVDAAVVLSHLGEDSYASYILSRLLSALKDMLASGVAVETFAVMEENLRSLHGIVEHAFGVAMGERHLGVGVFFLTLGTHATSMQWYNVCTTQCPFACMWRVCSQARIT